LVSKSGYSFEFSALHRKAVLRIYPAVEIFKNWVYGFKLQLKKKNFFYLLLMPPRTIKVNEESAKHPSCTWIQISFQNLEFLVETKLNLASCQKVIS
jgi:hypothetical protein